MMERLDASTIDSRPGPQAFFARWHSTQAALAQTSTTLRFFFNTP